MNDDNVAGAPLETQSSSDIKGTLEGIGADFVVQIHNPLGVMFRAKFARTVTQQPNMNAQELRHQQRMAELGIPVTKDGNSQISHVVQYYEIPAGATRNLPGDIAQVVARQMVTTILQIRNKGQASNQVADPFQRQLVEKEIILNYKSAMQLINENPEDIISRQIDELNQPQQTEEVSEPAFPDLNAPAPGTGTTYEPDQGNGEVSESATAAAPSSPAAEADSAKRGRPIKAAA